MAAINITLIKIFAFLSKSFCLTEMPVFLRMELTVGRTKSRGTLAAVGGDFLYNITIFTLVYICGGGERNQGIEPVVTKLF